MDILKINAINVLFVAKPAWMLNTLKNVRLLESHVGKEIHNFMKCQPSRCIFAKSQHKAESKQIIETKQLCAGTKKVMTIHHNFG